MGRGGLLPVRDAPVPEADHDPVGAFRAPVGFTLRFLARLHAQRHAASPAGKLSGTDARAGARSGAGKRPAPDARLSGSAVCH